jgi:hypothetical protein
VEASEQRGRPGRPLDNSSHRNSRFERFLKDFTLHKVVVTGYLEEFFNYKMVDQTTTFWTGLKAGSQLKCCTSAGQDYG